MIKTLKLRLHFILWLMLTIGLSFAFIGNARAENFLLPAIPPDQVVVKPKPNISINTILTRYNATLLGSVTETNLYFLQLSAGQTADQILPILNADPDLYYAEPNYYIDDDAPGGSHIMIGAHQAPLAEHIMIGAHGGLTPTPPAGGSPQDQWAWNALGLADAQKISTGQSIIIAVLDTGMAPDHPLLNSSITAGYDFVGMRTDISDRGNGIDDDSDGVIDSFVGHGTHVSGIIVTEAPGVQIMPIRVLNSEGLGTYWELSAGIKYAVDHGAKIINMSLSAPRLTPSLKDALDYASARGVIVVSAAGTGTDPNYPAAYSNPLALGVGATDENDAIAWFSGGQAGDTDIYAPGSNIYSAYPYNGYRIASGTSMSTPIVAAEAALLMARYRDWTPAQVTQRILTKTNPVTNSAIGRVHLGKALNTGLEADYAVGDFGSPNDNNLKPSIRLINHTPENIPLSELKVRYWYTVDTTQSQIFNCDYTPIGCGNVTGAFVSLPGNSANRTNASDTYLEVGFSTNAGTLAAGGQFDMYLRLNKSDWSNYVETGDYSYDANRTVISRWDRVTLYRNGILMWGVEPSNNQAGATATTLPATATSTAIPATATKTATSVPATATRTNTPIAATATKTATPTAIPATATKTATPLPPAATATRTATLTSIPPTVTSSSSAVKIQYMPGATAASSQAIAPKIILFNNGTSSIPLSEIKIRYWYTADGSQPQSYWCDYAAFGCSNISVQFVTLTTPRTGADTYLEISFSNGAGSLAPGSNTNQIQNRFSKNDWSYYTQTGDYSFDASKTQFADWNRITVYRNGVLIWGIEP